MTLFFSLLLTDSMALIRAEVPDRWEEVKSAVAMCSLRFRAVETMPAFRRSRKGRLVEAR